GEVLRRIGLREGHIDLALLAGSDADELILEAWNEGVRSDVDTDVAAGATVERRAVDLAGEVDDNAIAGLGLAPRLARHERPALFGNPLDGLVDLGRGHLGAELFELDALEVGELDRRHDLNRHGVGEIGLAVDDLINRALLFRQGDLGLAREPEAAFGD